MGFWRSKPPPGAVLQRQHPLTRGLVGCWLLNEGSGSKITDLAQDQPVSSFASATVWRMGKEGPALDFGAVGSEVRIAQRGAYFSNSNLSHTVVARIYWPAASPRQWFWNLGEFADSNFDLAFGVDATNHPMVTTAGNPSAQQIASTLTIPTGVWSTVGFSQSAVAARTFLANGLLAANTTSASTGTLSASNPHILGRAYENSVADSSDAFTGRIGWIYVWKRALTNAELLAVYTDPFGFVAPPPFLRRWFFTASGSSWTQGLSESLDLSDNRASGIGKTIADPVSLSDVREFLAGKTLSDALTVSDALARQAGKPAAETVTLTDAIVRGGGKGLPEPLAITDTRSAGGGKGLSEAVVVSDTRSSQPSKPASETVSLSDTRVAQAGKGLSDPLSLSDLLTRGVAKILSDPVSFTDLLSLQTGKALTDSLSVSDTFGSLLNPNAGASLVQWKEPPRTKPLPGVRLRGAHPLSKSLLAAWLINEGAGTPFDLTTGKRLALSNGPAWTGSSQGAALAFTAASSQSASALLDLSAAQTITVEFWLRWNTYANDDSICMEFSSNNNLVNTGFIIDPNDSSGTNPNSMSIGMHLAGGYNNSLITRPSAGVWHHYAVVFDRTAPGATAVLPYVDGVAVAYNKNASTAPSGNFASDTLYLMSRAGTSLFGSGALAKLSVYTRALTPREIAQLATTSYANVFTPSSLRLLGVPATGASLSRSLSESLTLSDGRTLLMGKAVSELLTLLDVRSVAGSKGLTDVLALTDTRFAAVTKGLAEALGLTDTRTSTAAKALADALGLTDARSAGVGHALSEPISLTDIRTSGAGKGVAQSVPLTDTQTRSPGKGLPESVPILDAVATTGNRQQTFSEPFSLTDARSAGSVRGLLQSLSLSDLLALGFGRSLAETLTLTDAQQHAVSKALAENLGLLEGLSMTGNRQQALLEALSLTDTRSTQARKSLLESLPLLDIRVVSAGKAVADALALSDVRSLALAKALLQSLSISDAVTGLILGSLLHLQLPLLALLTEDSKPRYALFSTDGSLHAVPIPPELLAGLS